MADSGAPSAKPGPKILNGLKLLSDLTPDELVELERYCKYKKFERGEQILDRAAQTRDVFFVARGCVRVVNYSVSGREVTLDDIAQGGHFGELAAIDGEPRSASVMALTDAVIVALPPKKFLEILEKHPKVALRVMRQLSRIIRNSVDRIMDLSTLGAHNRVRADVLRLAKAHMDETNRAAISPIPVHGDIGSRVGTTRETVARVLGDLARRGIVERRKDALVIRDVRRLETLVEQVRGE